MTSLLREVAASWPVTVILAFLALYPVVTAAVWVITALLYARRREGTSQAGEAFYAIPDRELPRVSVLVPAYREEAGLERTLEALHVLNYPDYEVLVVDDGSPDGRPTSRGSTSLETRASGCCARRSTRARPWR